MPVAAAYVVCALVWGTTWFAIRVSIAPEGYPTFAASALRFTVATVVLGALWLVGIARPGPRNRRQLAWMFAAGVCNAAGYGLLYRAEESISGGLAAVVFGMFPLVTALLAAITRVERAPASSVVGALLGVAGIALIFWDRLDVSATQGVAVVMVAGAVVMSSIYSIIFKVHAADLHPLASTGVFFGVTAVLMWAFTGAVEREPLPWPPPQTPTLAVVYLGTAGTALVFSCYFYLVKRVRLMTLAMLVFIEPIIALCVDALFEHEVELTGRTYAGIAVTLTGVLANALWAPRRARAVLAQATRPAESA